MSAVLLADERAAIPPLCRRMITDGLVVGTSGNVSVRRGDLIAITPGGLDYAAMRPEHVCVVDLDGTLVDGALAPSSELPMHLAAYRRTPARAVVHTHPLFATAVSVVCDELPAVHYLVALLGGPVPVVGYATYGSEELADGAARGLEGRGGVLLRNHGATTIGRDLDEAYTRSVYLEWLCRLYHEASQLGTPRLLDPDELARAADKLSGYGQTPPD